MNTSRRHLATSTSSPEKLDDDDEEPPRRPFSGKDAPSQPRTTVLDTLSDAFEEATRHADWAALTDRDQTILRVVLLDFDRYTVSMSELSQDLAAALSPDAGEGRAFRSCLENSYGADLGECCAQFSEEATEARCRREKPYRLLRAVDSWRRELLRRNRELLERADNPGSVDVVMKRVAPFVAMHLSGRRNATRAWLRYLKGVGVSAAAVFAMLGAYHTAVGSDAEVARLRRLNRENVLAYEKLEAETRELRRRAGVGVSDASSWGHAPAALLSLSAAVLGSSAWRAKYFKHSHQTLTPKTPTSNAAPRASTSSPIMWNGGDSIPTREQRIRKQIQGWGRV